MSHNLYFSNGQASMAYVGQRPWHGFGQRLEAGQDFQTWLQAAGMDFEVLSSVVAFAAQAGGDLCCPGMEKVINWDDRKVLYRSDTLAPLNVVSNQYKVVQPADVLAFFDDLVKEHGLTLETAGVLRNGGMYWALARTNDQLDIHGDVMESYVMLATSCDGSLQTVAKQTSVRVVCNNTLDCAVASKGTTSKTSHRQTFDADQAKADLGIVLDQHQSGWQQFSETMRTLADCPVNANEAKVLFAGLLNDRAQIEKQELNVAEGDGQALLSQLLQAPVQRDTVTVSTPSRAFESLYDIYQNGPGQDTKAAQDTAFGVLNAVTRYVDHERKARSDENRRQAGWFGDGARMKKQAAEMVMTFAEDKAAV